MNAEEHHPLGASRARTWMHCTGSMVGWADHPSDQGSYYADEGNFAHPLAAQVLHGETTLLNLELNLLVGRSEHAPYEIPCTEEMVDAIQIYTDGVRDSEQIATILGMVVEREEYIPCTLSLEQERIEHRVSLDPYVPGAFGTVDHGAIWRIHAVPGRKSASDKFILAVSDFKYGQGVVVDARENDQTRLYALGMLNEFYNAGWTPEMLNGVVGIIWQPRIHPDPSYERLTVEELEEYGRTRVAPAAAKAIDVLEGRIPEGGVEYVPSEHTCRWCPKRGSCAARAQAMYGVVAWDSDEAQLTERHATEDARAATLEDWPVKDPGTLAPEELGALLLRLEPVLEWIGQVRDYADRVLQEGGTVPGWKLVIGREGNRAWAHTVRERALVIALRRAGVTNPWVKTLMSPTMAEKQVGKARYAELLAPKVFRSPGKPVRVREGDKRPAYQPGEVKFENDQESGYE